MVTVLGKEPINFTQWSPKAGTDLPGALYSCGRPGRAVFGTERVSIPEEVIRDWILGLPKSEKLHIVSLLGSKKDGYSEFQYYPFRSAKEEVDKPTWQEWLNERYEGRFIIHEFPTVDAQGKQKEVLDSASRCILALLEGGNTVVVVDSAGAERTGRVCEFTGFKK